MKRIYAALAALAVLGAWPVQPAQAAPPTVTPSPGYDARLQESRARSSATVQVPIAPAAKPGVRHRKRTHAH
jgi:hypothetical protein